MAKRAPAIPDPAAMAQRGAAGSLPSDDDDIRSAEAARPALSWPWLTLSGLGHALVIAALLGLWRTAPLPEEPVVKVMLLADGRGAAGAAGGAQGGGGAAASAATEAAAPAASAPEQTAPAEPAPVPEVTTSAAKPEPAPPPAATPPPPVETADLPAEPPPPPKPRPPHHVTPRPRPLQAAKAEPAPRPVAPAEPQKTAQSPPEKETKLAAAPLPEPAPGAPGSGGESGGAAGAGRGAEGAGHGAIGGGPVTGPGDDYLDRLRNWLAKYKQYPKAAAQQKQEGGLVVSFTISRDGTVLSPAIERSSGFPLLDAAALKMLRDASPVPPLPPSYRPDRAAIDLPVDFTIGFFDRLF